MLSYSLHICILNLTPSQFLSTSKKYVVLLSLHLPPQSDTIMLLHPQFVCCPTFFTSASSIWCHHTFSPPPGSTLSCSPRICVFNLTPSSSLSTSSWYVVLLSLHPGPQSNIITHSLHLQLVSHPALFASGSTIWHHYTPSPPPGSASSCSLCIWVHNLTPSRSLSTSSWYIVLLCSHLGPQSDTITLSLHLQEVRLPALFTSGSTIWHYPALSPPLVGTSSYSVHIWVHNLTPFCSLSTFSWYVVLLCLHPGPQSDTITLSLHLQRVCCPALFAFRFTISHHPTPSLPPESTLSYSVRIQVYNLTPSCSLSHVLNWQLHWQQRCQQWNGNDDDNHSSGINAATVTTTMTAAAAAAAASMQQWQWQ